jgi:glycosyltransferase involved in cell wall biosynthesis
MKITYDYQTFNLQEYGGIPRYFYEIATRLSNVSGVDASILAFSYINQYLKDSPSGLVTGMQRPVLPKTGQAFGAINKELSRLWLRYQKTDILHETYYSRYGVAPNDCTIILTVYDMIHEKLSSSVTIDSDRTRKLKESAVRRADHIICISESTKTDLLEFIDVDPAKVSVIHLGHSFIKSTPIYSDIPDPYILYIGLRQGYKNFNGLLRAYAASSKINSNFKLLCFGSHPFSKDEMKLINELNLTENQVIYAGRQDKMISHLYSNASAFIYPSLYEGFGIPPLEAMNFGCPVICSNLSSIPEVVGDAGELFDPYSINSIVTAMENVLFSTERTHELIQKGAIRKEMFSWDKCANETLQLYYSLK